MIDAVLPRFERTVVYSSSMDAFALTRQLVDIESITGNEAAVGEVLYSELCRLGYQTKKMPVEGDRFNVYATSPEQPRPAVVFSTHMDTVPPFIASSEDSTRIFGRGSCDAKGIIAAQIAASERLRQEGIHVGLLFVVGEERDSLGAKVANEYVRRTLSHGEAASIWSTANQPRTALRWLPRERCAWRSLLRARMAHSAYPELGESAIDKLIPGL